jgi:hypothetical protein
VRARLLFLAVLAGFLVFVPSSVGAGTPEVSIEFSDYRPSQLDVLPGEVLKGRVRSVGYGVSSGQEAPPGTLPTIQNSRDWLRQAQRFPVAIEFDPFDAERLRKVRIGGQAEVMVFTGHNLLMNMLGAFYIRLRSWLSYLY